MTSDNINNKNISIGRLIITLLMLLIVVVIEHQ